MPSSSGATSSLAACPSRRRQQNRDRRIEDPAGRDAAAGSAKAVRSNSNGRAGAVEVCAGCRCCNRSNSRRGAPRQLLRATRLEAGDAASTPRSLSHPCVILPACYLINRCAATRRDRSLASRTPCRPRAPCTPRTSNRKPSTLLDPDGRPPSLHSFALS